MDEAIRARLPRRHVLALRLVELGAPDDLIAECLGVEPEAVAPLLAVANTKLAQAVREGA